MLNNISLSLNLTNEMKLLLEILKVENNDSLNSINKDLLKHIDWVTFLRLVKHHRVYPSIYKKIVDLSDNVGVPLDIQNKLFRLYQNNAFQMLYLSGEMELLTKLFVENSVSSLVLKGPALALDLYGDISLRTSSDLDILISIKDLDKIENIIIKEGYIKYDYFSTVLNDWKWRHHHTSYFHPIKKIKLEIHWRLNPGPSKEPSFNELWSRRRKCTLPNSQVFFLGYEDLFLFLVSHGARHGWSRLRWVEDIDKISKKELNWEKIRKLLKQYHFLQIGGQAITLSSQLLKTPIDEKIQKLIITKKSKRFAQDAMFYINQMVSLHDDHVSEEVANYHKKHLFSIMSFQQKFLFILSFLYPYPKDVEILPLPKSVHFLYFPLRPFLWAWRKTRKHVISKGV
jgi:hypothetical protein